MTMLKCYQRTHSRHYSLPFSFSLKQQRLHKTHRNHRTWWPCDFPRNFQGKLKKKIVFPRVSRRIPNFQEFPGVWQPYSNHPYILQQKNFLSHYFFKIIVSYNYKAFFSHSIISFSILKKLLFFILWEIFVTITTVLSLFFLF